MMKKLISLICCLLPVGAVADVLEPIGGSATVSTTQFPTDGTAIVIGGGNGIDAPTGLDVENNMYVGAATDMGALDGSLVVLNTATTPFTVLAGGNVSVGAMLQVLDGWRLDIKTTGTGWDVDLGVLDNQGIFNTDNINTFTSGQISSDGELNIVANDAVNVAGVTASGVTTIAAKENGIVVAGGVQNNAGQMSLQASGDVDSIKINGNLENSGAKLDVTAGDLIVGGTMKNDSDDGLLTLNVDSWTVSGGDGSYSFINNGNVNAKVKNAVSFANGMNLSGMDVDNLFYLQAGQLDLGANAALTNHLNQMDIIISNGGLTLDGVLNKTIENENDLAANMTLDVSGQFVADSVGNQGNSLTVDAGTIVVKNSVTGIAGGTTKLMASSAPVNSVPTLDIQGALSNSGNMVLNGQYVQVNSAVNNGNSMQITSLTSDAGKIVVAGDIANSAGTTTVWARDVTVGGSLVNNGGTVNLYASDTRGGAVQLGAVEAKAGVTNLNALAGQIGVDGNVTVSQAIDETGALNILSSVHNMTVGGNVHVSGDFNASSVAATGNGNMNVMAADTAGFALGADSVLIDGDVNVTDASNVRNITFTAPLIVVGQDVNVAGKGYVNMGTAATSYVDVARALNIRTGGVFESSANSFVVGTMNLDGKFIMHGSSVVADNGSININGNLYFDPVNDVQNPSSGLIVRDGTQGTVNAFDLKTTATADDVVADITVGAVSVGVGKTLGMNSVADVSVGGNVSNNGQMNVVAAENTNLSGMVVNTGSMTVSGASVNMENVINTNTMTISAENENGDADIKFGVVKTDGNLDITAESSITAQSVNQGAGIMNLDAANVVTSGFAVQNAVANVDAANFTVNGNLRVGGDLVHAGNGGVLNVNADKVFADYLTTDNGNFAINGDAYYDVKYNMNIGSDLINASDAQLIVGNLLSVGGAINNSGVLNIDAGHGIVAQSFVNNAGNSVLDAGVGALDFGTLQVNAGTLSVAGTELFVDSAISTGAMLYQGYNGDMQAKDINVITNDFVITTGQLNVAGINQNGSLVVNTSDISVGGNVVASDLRFVASKDNAGNTIWQNVAITGNVSGDVDFIGLEKLTINKDADKNNGNYTFSDDSQIHAAILPYASGSALDTTDINYWASVNLSQDGTLGQIVNPTDDAARALIQVDGVFTGGKEYVSDNALALGQGQIGITLFDAVDQGTAIWLLHADGGVKDVDNLTLLRNLDVRFCNADGSICYDYLESLDDANASDNDLPAYVSVRDFNKDGVADDLYVVFDPRFGGPVLLNDLQLQPIVERTEGATYGEVVSAGALDNAIAGQLEDKKFFNDTPLELLPVVFQDTNLSGVANELYVRLEEYNKNFDGSALMNFARLFQVHEAEQLMGGMVLNEHTFARSFEDRMFDEFIWNRNRNLKKAWVDMDYGMFYQNVADAIHSDGNRFSLSGGFDWQHSDTLILGLIGRVSHTASDVADTMNLGYLVDSFVGGNVHVDVADTDIGFGAYLMKTLGEKARLYGNAFVDMHVFDVDRVQNFVSTIEGDGATFSLISEWGLMHDILNQYVVGNLYARFGYNFGLDITEKAAGADYMNIESDGYLMLTPGYSLMAQKRIYPSAWFQMRPYASVGVEYDIFGAPDNIQYKFAVADKFSKYDIDIDPLWANIGGGIEFVYATGVQVGIDYRYQYNDAIQLHNIKVSGSYRF